ncbi:MAG: class I SAM-dependent methyltransferase [Bacteroidales bacterium]|nr:class I SAM-dependent methyltransferase [Bacteroidales bacterium]
MDRCAQTKENTEFTSAQYEAIYPEGIEHHYWTKSRNWIIAKAIKKYDVKGKILEIGCGKGLVVEYLNKNGFDCSGVELADVPVSPSLQDKILTGKDVKDLSSDYCDAFSTILLLDVIEHIADPVSFLRNLKTKFKNLKTIVLTAPARQELFSNYDEFNGHYRRYDWHMLRSLAAETNIRVIYQSYFFHALYLPARLILWLFGKRKLYMTAPSGIAKWIHTAIAWFMYFDALLLPKKLGGTSLIAVMKI